MSEVAFENMPVCKKMKVLGKQMCSAIKKKPVIIICFVGSSISKIINVLFSTYWLLFICSFIPEDIATQKEA